jgi:hypothetical protein
MNGLVEGIMASEDVRTKSRVDIRSRVSALKYQSRAMIKYFQRKRMDADVKGILVKGDKARLHDFNNMMTGINKSISDVQKEVSDLSDRTQAMMEGYRDEHKWMAIDWAKMKELLKNARSKSVISNQ